MTQNTEFHATGFNPLMAKKLSADFSRRKFWMMKVVSGLVTDGN